MDTKLLNYTKAKMQYKTFNKSYIASWKKGNHEVSSTTYLEWIDKFQNKKNYKECTETDKQNHKFLKVS